MFKGSVLRGGFSSTWFSFHFIFELVSSIYVYVQKIVCFLLKIPESHLALNVYVLYIVQYILVYPQVLWSGLRRVGHRVLFRSERSVLSHSKKRTLRSFPFFSRVFGDLWDPKERYVLFRSFEKNGNNVMFFYKERKRTQRT